MRLARLFGSLVPALASAALLFVAVAARPALGPVVAGFDRTGLLDPPVAVAQGVPRLAGQITDDAAVVGSGRAALQAALDALLQDHNVQLYVAFVPTTGSQTASSFVQETFDQNGLGGNDVLLLVAVGDRRYAWWQAAQGGTIPQSMAGAVDGLLSQTLEPHFRAGDYAGGVAAFADALGPALAGGAALPPGGPNVPAGATPAATGSPAAQSADTTAVGILVGVILVVLGLALVWAFVYRWRMAHLAAEERDRRTGQLARQANQLLIAADDGVRGAGQELGFAEAEFSTDDVRPFQDALAQARAELKAAFAVRQMLDDEIPEDPPTREAMLNEVIARAGRVADILGAQRQRFTELRDLERRAPELLAAVPGLVASIQGRLPDGEAAMARLRTCADSTWAPVKGNLEEARKRLEFASAAAARGMAGLSATPPDPHVARDAVRAAQGAVAQAGALLDAVDHLAASVDDARSRIDPEIAAAAADVDAADAAIRAGGADPALTDRLAEARTRLEAARAQGGAAAPDPLAALKAAQDAHAAADQVLAGIRAAEEQRSRERAALQAALASAQASLTHASDYVEGRRHGLGREARTRLAEAERHLDQAQALASTDPASAIREAQQARSLADEAYRVASSEFDDWNMRGGRGGGNVAGAIIGGIVLGSILGGGRRGGGWGGTPWGLPGGRGGFGGFGGGGGWGGGGGGGGGFGGGGSW